MNKTTAYRTLSDRGFGFVANVVSSRENGGRRLVKLAILALAGHSVSFAQFSTSVLLIDGSEVRWSALDAARISKGTVIWAENPELSESEKRIEGARVIVASGVCPSCGGKIVRNLALTGWYVCEVKGCSFQTFTE
jgi:hypothetical protein